MNRRNFVELLTLSGSAVASGLIPAIAIPVSAGISAGNVRHGKNDFSADVVIAGAGMGGFAAAMAALRNGRSVLLTEETDWIGGQLTQQGLSCPDEHQWIETHGATQLYRDYRTAVREYYKRNYPLTDEARARKNLNPGDGSVSRLCHEPRVALAVLYSMIAPYLSSGKLKILLEHKIVSAEVTGNKVIALKARSTKENKREVWLKAPYFIDGTELGDLLP
ncbi:MAG: FAD-dependent oxidoreductase, partial [Ginsengibacter sp.]